MIRVLHLTAVLGTTTGIADGKVGVTTSLLSTLISSPFIQDLQPVGQIILTLQGQKDLLVAMMLRYQGGLSPLTAEKPALCLFLQYECQLIGYSKRQDPNSRMISKNYKEPMDR